jgi:hypothetical protein
MDPKLYLDSFWIIGASKLEREEVEDAVDITDGIMGASGACF